MRPLSATESISPAIERTKLMLFTPFRKGRTWKLCATAYLCRGGTLFFPFPLIYLIFLPAAYRTGGTMLATVVGIGVLLLTAFFLFLFYLCSRLQFAYLDMVLNRGEFVAPAWRKYGPASLPWTGVKVLLGAAVTLACAPPLTAYVHQVIPLMRSLQTITPGQPPPPQMMTAIFSFYAAYFVFLLVLGVFFLVSSLFSDFIVPSLALEDTGLKEAFRRMGALVRGEPGEFALYTLLKTVLGIAAYLGAILAWEIAFVLVSLLLGAVVFLIGFVLHLAGIPSAVLTVCGFVLAILWSTLCTVYTVVFPLGIVLTFLDAYALYFLGGRYPLLGDLLDRSTPPPAGPYPPPIYPAYLPGQPPPPLPDPGV